MAGRVKKRWIVLGSLVVSVLVAATIVLSLPVFGGKLSGERLLRAQANTLYRDGAFHNVEPQAEYTRGEFWALIKGQFSGNEVRIPPAPIPVLPVSPTSLAAREPSVLRGIWLGHSSVLVEIDGQRILLDPIFSEYASPFEIGPRRLHPTPIALEDVPVIDAVLISHDHYDHLDMRTIQHLARHGSRFFVPLGVGAHLEEWGVPPGQIQELEWWQEAQVGPVRIICTPSRHYSGRGLTDRQATLWSSWSVLGLSHRFYYSGDTGYSPHFREIGERFGPFDMSFVKIGAYGPGAPWTDIHMTPESAVQAHVDLRARRMFPVHWSTFNLAFHDWDEPIRRALHAASDKSVDLVTPRVGEVVDADRNFGSVRWWEEVNSVRAPE